MNFLKKYPIPIAGLILSMFALGNLLQSYSANLRFAIGAVASVLYFVYLLKVLVLNCKMKTELENPVVASVFLTFTMATILMSTYIIPINITIAKFIWYLGIFGHIALILWFSSKFLLNFNIKKVFPSWYIVYVGIAVASVTAPAFKNLFVGQIAFWFSFIGYFVLVGVVCYRVFVIKEIPDPAKPTLVILSAPASLLLAGYINSFPEKQNYMLILLAVFSITFYIIALSFMPKLLKLKFSPAYSSFTFPLVISAISTKLLNGYLKGSVAGLGILVKIQEVIAVIVVLFVLINYLIFLFRINKQTS